jgi:hypothetical protein
MQQKAQLLQILLIAETVFLNKNEKFLRWPIKLPLVIVISQLEAIQRRDNLD